MIQGFSPELQEHLKEKEKILNIIWLVLTFSILVFVFVSNTIKLENQLQDQRSVLIYQGIAIYIFLMAYFIRKFFLSKAKKENIPKSYRILNNHKYNLSEKDQQIAAFANFYPLPLILSLSLHESIAVIGFVASITSGDSNTIYPFALLAFISNILLKPSYQKFFEKYYVN